MWYTVHIIDNLSSQCSAKIKQQLSYSSSNIPISQPHFFLVWKPLELENGLDG